MLKNTNLRRVGLTISSLLLLAACSAKSGPVEDSALVMEKMLSEPTKIYASQTSMEFKFSEPENNQSGTIKMNAEEKVNMEDYENSQSDGSVKINADLNLLDSNYNAETESLDKNLAKVTASAEAEVKVVGKDIYASLKQLDLGGTLKQLEQAKALIPLFVQPYIDETVYLSMDSLESTMKELQPQAGGANEFEALKTYAGKEIYTDLAASKMLVVKQDAGVEKYKTTSGKKVNAYHYQVELNSEGFLAFLTTLNSKLNLGIEADLEAMTQEKDPSLAQVMEVVNQAIKIEMWIGQENYHPYKVKISSDLKQIQAALEKIKTLNKDFTLNEADENFLKKGVFNMDLTVESEPIEKFTVEKPSKEGVIDLGPIIETFLKNAESKMESPAMTDEQLNSLLNSQGVPEDLSTTTPQVTSEETVPSA